MLTQKPSDLRPASTTESISITTHTRTKSIDHHTQNKFVSARTLQYVCCSSCNFWYSFITFFRTPVGFFLSFQLLFFIFSGSGFRGGRDPPLAQCELEINIVETLNNVGHHYAYRIEIMWTSCGVSYIVQCPHKDVSEAHIVEGGGPGHLCCFVVFLYRVRSHIACFTLNNCGCFVFSVSQYVPTEFVYLWDESARTLGVLMPLGRKDGFMWRQHTRSISIPRTKTNIISTPLLKSSQFDPRSKIKSISTPPHKNLYNFDPHSKTKYFFTFTQSQVNSIPRLNSSQFRSP